MAKLTSFTAGQLESICKAIGDTQDGLTGSEIGRVLAQCGIRDPGRRITKWKRLNQALSERQENDGCGNKVATFIQRAMEPARWSNQPNRFRQVRDRLNEALSFAGLKLDDSGKLIRVSAAETLSEAQKRASRLRSELNRRNVHGDVLHFSKAEILERDYFHAVLEATKSLFNKIREKAGVSRDGADVVDAAFGRGKREYPVLAFNSLETETENMEHSGLMSLMKGVYGAFRNPTAHEARIHWEMTEQDALDTLTLLSMLHRRLDRAFKTRV